MTEFLIRCFVCDRDHTEKPQVRAAYGNLAGIVGIFCNVCLFLGKYLIGTWFGSIAIAADALNNLSDASSNVVTLLGFKLGAKKPDAEHPYGHGRYEYLAGLVVCVIILAIGISLAKESLLKIIHPTEVTFRWLSVIVLLVSIGVKAWMSVFNRKIGKKIHSETLIATAADSWNDVISSGVVVGSTFLCAWTGIARIDGIMGLGVSVFILYSGIGLLRDTLSPLLGKAPDAELVQKIEQKVKEYPYVRGVHELMVHDYGPGHVFATLHLEFDADTDVIEAHDIIDNIEKYFLEQEHILMTIHYDPIDISDQRTMEVRKFLESVARELDPQLSVHDIRMVSGKTHSNVVFDCMKPAGFQISDDKIRKYFYKKLEEFQPKYRCVMRIEQSYV